MLENTPNSQERQADLGRKKASEVAAAPQFTDREVPLGNERMGAAVHAWLDGELPEAAVRGGDTARQVEFWQRINKETEMLRATCTPAHLAEEIMQAIPQTTPTVITPWWKRPVSVTPVAVLAASAGMLALGMALGSNRSR